MKKPTESCTKLILVTSQVSIKLKKAAFIFSICCISILLWKDIAALGYNVWFYKNQVELAEQYCENKAKPEMHCNGKCYLAKKLQKLEQEKEEKKPVPRIPYKLKSTECVFSDLNYYSASTSSYLSPISQTQFFKYAVQVTTSHISGVFHPPQV